MPQLKSHSLQRYMQRPPQGKLSSESVLSHRFRYRAIAILPSKHSVPTQLPGKTVRPFLFVVCGLGFRKERRTSRQRTGMRGKESRKRRFLSQLGDFPSPFFSSSPPKTVISVPRISAASPPIASNTVYPQHLNLGEVAW